MRLIWCYGVGVGRYQPIYPVCISSTRNPTSISSLLRSTHRAVCIDLIRGPKRPCAGTWLRLAETPHQLGDAL